MPWRWSTERRQGRALGASEPPSSLARPGAGRLSTGDWARGDTWRLSGGMAGRWGPPSQRASALSININIGISSCVCSCGLALGH